MKLRCTDKADKDYAVLPVIIRKAFGKQLRFLLTNRSHPSLHAKKYSKALDVWQGTVRKRVSMGRCARTCRNTRNKPSGQALPLKNAHALLLLTTDNRRFTDVF
jgi:mRNA-degrading endonuclease RelE of RelBE toxin-antitoxin system